jgi:membrane protease YdiL (CAAX protease family)
VPGLASQIQAFVVATSLLIAALLAARGWWHAVGFTAPRHWHNPWVLLLPALVVAAPLVGGVRTDLDASQIAVFVVGYLFTGFAEESVFRGVLLRVLSPHGVRRAVLVSLLLFGWHRGAQW